MQSVHGKQDGYKESRKLVQKVIHFTDSLENNQNKQISLSS